MSWSHHWVWALPTVLVTSIVAYQRGALALALVSAAGVALMIWPPMELLPEHHEADASWWRQLFGMSYVWWALATIALAGLTLSPHRVSPRRSPGSARRGDLLPRT